MTDVGIEVLHRLLSHVIHGPREQVGVGDDQVTAFLETLKKGLLYQLLTLLTLISKFEFLFVVAISFFLKQLEEVVEVSTRVILCDHFLNSFLRSVL